jgi:hypothetical protein
LVTHRTPKTQIIELAITTFITNIMLGANHKSKKIQNGPTPCEHVTQNLRVTSGETPIAFIHLSKP